MGMSGFCVCRDRIELSAWRTNLLVTETVGHEHGRGTAGEMSVVSFTRLCKAEQTYRLQEYST